MTDVDTAVVLSVCIVVSGAIDYGIGWICGYDEGWKDAREIYGPDLGVQIEEDEE